MTWKCTNTPKGENKLYSDAKGVVPSLDLRFAEGKTLNDYMTGTPLVDHQRSMSGSNLSPGTFVNSSGLIETAKINLLLYSQDLSQGFWAKGATTTVDADSTLAPDGTFTADALGTTSTGFVAYRDYNIAGTYTASAYIKDNGAGSCLFAMGTTTQGYLINLNTITGVYISGRSYGGGTLVSYSINPVSNGWFRVIVTATAGAGGVVIGQADGTSPTSGVYVWGVQLEEGTTATTYIPTTNLPSAAPRFDHDPTTGESLGLLIEESRTNLLLRSEEFNDVSAWNATNLIVNSNAVTAPDGQTTADLLTETTAPNANFYITQSTSVTSATTYTYSIRCKPNGRSRLYLAGSSQTWGAGFITFDLLNNVVSGSQGWTGTISSLSNGWYSITATQTASTTGVYNLSLFLLNDSGNVTYTGDGTSGIYLWGAQLEAGAFPTSYIPTTTAALTRSADVASITGSNFSDFYNQNEGTIYCSFLAPTRNTGGSAYQIINFDDGTLNEYIGLSRSFDSVQIDAQIVTGYATQAALSIYPIPVGGQKIALTYGSNYARLAAAGSLSLVDSSVTLPNLNRLQIGQKTLYTQYGVNSTISRLTYFPERLPDATLQAITAT